MAGAASIADIAREAKPGVLPGRQGGSRSIPVLEKKVWRAGPGRKTNERHE